MTKNKAGVVLENKGAGLPPAGDPPPPKEDPPNPPPAPGPDEIDPENIDEKGGEGKQVPVSVLIKMRQDRNKLRDEIAGLKKSGVSDTDLKKAMRETINEMAAEEEERRAAAAAEAESAEGEDYDWNDPKLKPLARRFQKFEEENKRLRERIDQRELNEETGKVKKEVDEALEKFPNARRKEVLAEAYLHPDRSIMEIAEESHKEMESHNSGVISKYATEKGIDDKGGGGPGGGQPPVTPGEKPDIEGDTKGFVSRLKEKLKISA